MHSPCSAAMLSREHTRPRSRGGDGSSEAPNESLAGAGGIRVGVGGRFPMAEIANRITVNPRQCGGRPCVRGMRIRVIDVLELLASGLTPQQIVDELPDLEAEDITACPRFARDRLDHPILAA